MSIINKKALVIKTTESDRLFYQGIKDGIVVTIESEHFNGSFFYVKDESGNVIGRLQRHQLVVIGVDRDKDGYLVVNAGKKRTHFLTVCLGQLHKKGRYIFHKTTSLRSVLAQF